MPLTSEQRSEINRRNASKSTGPKTLDGKAASRQNALKHGLRAEILALPNEDPVVVEARAIEWNDYYKPQSPGAQHLVNECVRATILSDRVATYHDFTVGKQVRDATNLWDRNREDDAVGLFSELETDPAATVRLLKRTGHGCELLIREWEKLKTALDDVGHWSATQFNQMIMLLGERPGLKNLAIFPKGYMACLLNSILWGEPGIVWIEALCDPKNVPDSLAKVVRIDALPDDDEARDGLREMASQTIDELTDFQINTIDPIEFPDRDEAEARAMILVEEKSARLFLRYHAEARNAFHRAYGQLVKTLDRDARAEKEGESESPNEAKPAAEGVENVKIFQSESESGGSFLRNEPNEASRSGVEFLRPLATVLALFLLILGSGFRVNASEIEPLTVAKPQATDRPLAGLAALVSTQGSRGFNDGRGWDRIVPRADRFAVLPRLASCSHRNRFGLCRA